MFYVLQAADPPPYPGPATAVTPDQRTAYGSVGGVRTVTVDVPASAVEKADDSSSSD